MRTKIITVLSVLAVALSTGLATHSSEQKEDPSKTTNQPAQDQRGTEEMPLVIKSVASEESEDDAAHRRYEQHEKPALERRLTWSTIALAVFTFLLFVFTGLLWWATYKLGKQSKAEASARTNEVKESLATAARAATAMEELAKATQSNATLMPTMLRKQMRAYVAVELATAVFQDKVFVFGADIIIKNTGFTPARNVSFWSQAAALETSLPAEFKFPDEGRRKPNDASLAPRQDFVIHTAVTSRFEEADVLEIMKGEKRRLYVWGVVTYEDIYGETWETRFCHNYVFVRDADDTIKSRGFYYRTHNAAT